MRLRLESKIAKFLTFAVVIALLAPYSYVAWSRYHAAQVAEAGDRDSLERAVELQPGDAAYQERLARYMLFVDQDAAGALAHYRIAADIDPYSARSWLGVAQSQLILGDSDAALKAIDHALEVDPQTPSVRWEAGNLLITLGQVPRAMQQFRFTLENDPFMVAQGLQLIRRMAAPSDAAKYALPPDPAIYATFIDMLLQNKDLDGARQVWPHLIALHKSFDPHLSYFYITSLAVSGDLDGAVAAWKDLEKVLPEIARLQQGNNLIHNAGFEYPISNGGFDWTLPDTYQRPLLQNDISDPHEGRRSLMVSFDATRPSSIGVCQFLVLEPNTRYKFTGFMKAKLETANGLRFAILDPKTGTRLMETDDVVESRQWKELSVEFHTGPEKRLYLLNIERTGNTLVRGSAWIDDLRLVKESQ